MTCALPTVYITLVIANPEQLLHGCSPSRQFGHKGGSIGSIGCDWLLHDRQQHVRPQHCALRQREGRFCVIDLCGQTRLNGHDMPLGVGKAIRLNDGDRLHIGAYNVIVNLHPADIVSHNQAPLFNQDESPLQALLNGFEAPVNREPCADITSTALQQLIRQAPPRDACDPLLALRATQAPAAERAVAPTHRSSADSSSTRYLTMRAAFMLLAVCLLLSSCTLLGKLGQVIVSPSTPVGEPDEQPSRISLSLYASRNVNPNPMGMHQAPDTLITESPTAYGATVSANNRIELSDKLHALLAHLQRVAPAQSPLLDEPRDPPESVPLMSAVEPVGLATYNDPMVTFTLPGQPSTLAPSAEQLATPIAFKVLQLKDDSLLRNATANALADDLKQALGSTWLTEDDYLLKPGEFKLITHQTLEPETRYLAVIARYHDTSRDTTQWKQTLRLEPTGRRYALLVHLDETRVELRAEHR